VITLDEIVPGAKLQPVDARTRELPKAGRNFILVQARCAM
jgi:hypothetical protein